MRSLATGTPDIDKYQQETGDKTWWKGHYHSNKAPGLAGLSLPAYVVLERIPPIAEHEDRMVSVLHVWSVVLAALGLFLGARYVGDRLTDGLGTIGAGALVLASLVLPFSTLYFSHVTAAALGLGAFALLLRDRFERPSAPWVPLGAGLLAGLSVVFEYPMGLTVVWLFAYAVMRPGRILRGLAYTAGVTIGVLPLVAYDIWQFGSAFHLSYTAQIVESGSTGHDVLSDNGGGFFGVTLPSLTGMMQILGADRGLLVLTPIAASGAAGLVLLCRVGRKPEAITCLGIVISTLLYNAGYNPSFGGVFGGDAPGPRFLIMALPFLFVPLGLAYRRAPVVVAALLMISTLTMVAATITDPRIDANETGIWWTRLRDADFVNTFATEVGATNGWLSIAPYLLAIGVGLLAIVLDTPWRPPRPREIAGAVGVVGAWALGAMIVPEVLANTAPGTSSVALAALVLLSSIALAVACACERVNAEPGADN